MIHKIIDRLHGKSEAWAITIMLVPILFAFRQLLLPGKLLLYPGCDGPFYFYPMTVTGMAQWRQGIIPLWTNLVHCGFPLLADGQGALLYPFNLMTFLICPAPVANNMVIVFQTLLSAILMYVFVRHIGVRCWAAIFAGWIWTVCGPVMASMGSPALNGLIWWPLWFLSADLIVKKNDWRMVAVAGLTMGFAWLGGFPQTTFYGAFGASVYLVFRALSHNWKQWKSCITPIVSWGIAGLLGLGIGSIQILSTMEMSVFSIRAKGADYALNTLGSMFPAVLAGFILPSWGALSEFQLAGSNLYLGLICLAAATITIRRKKTDAFVIFLWIMAATGCFLSFGKFNPCFKIVSLIPGFNFFRYPYRFTYWTIFALSILVSMGFERIFASIYSNSQVIKKMLVRISILAALTFGIALGGTFIFNAKKEIVIKKIQNYTYSNVVGGKYKEQHLEYYQEKIERMITAIATALDPLNKDVLPSIIFALCAIAVLVFALLYPHQKFKAITLLCLIAAANIWKYFGIVNTVPVPDFSKPPMAEAYADYHDKIRVYTVNTQKDLINGFYSQKRLDPDYNMLFSVEHAGVYSALGSLRYYNLMSKLGGVNLALGMPPVTDSQVSRNLPLLNLLNARIIVSNDSLNIPPLKKTPIEHPFAYLNDNALPRAFVVPESKTMIDPDEIIKAMQSPLYDPSKSVILETKPAFNPANGIYSTPHISTYQNLKITLEATGPGWLVLTDMYYPGWRARVDGKEADIYKGDFIFRALPLMEGAHKVEFYYISNPFKIGLAITIISLLALFGLYTFQTIFRRNARSA